MKDLQSSGVRGPPVAIRADRRSDPGKLKDLMTRLVNQASKPLVYRVENGVLTILPAPRTR